MKKFCTISIAFAILCFVTFVLLDIATTKVFQHTTARKYVGWNYVFYDTTYHDVLINGNSRALVQYSPYILDSILHTNVFNLGINGSDINRQIIKYRTYVRYHPSPKYLIQNIDYGTLDITYGYEREQFYPYFFDTIFINAVDKYEHFTFWERHLPYYRYMGYLKRPGEHNLYKGYEGIDAEWDGTKLARKESIDVCLKSDMYILLEEFLSECTQAGTKVLFVYAPIYHGATEKMTDLQAVYDTYRLLANEFAIPILDYNEDAICFDTLYFYNATHLNRRGAELFSTKLAQDIDSIGFLR